MLGLFNVDYVLSRELAKSIKVTEIEDGFDSNIKAIFIDWIPTYDKNSANKLLKQVDIIEKYTTKKKIPTIIFDKFRGLTNKEVDWFKKMNVKLFEPSIHLRSGFRYLPLWTKIKTLSEIEIDDHERKITLLYKGRLLSDRIKAFDNYYVESAKIYHKNLICYNSKNIISNKINEYKSFSVNATEDDYDSARFTIIIGSNPEYKDGYIDPTFFTALNKGCIPLLPIEHRYYASLKGIIISPEDLSWYIGMNYNDVYLGLIYNIYQEIEMFYPEMNVEYTAQIIKGEL